VDGSIDQLLSVGNFVRYDSVGEDFVRRLAKLLFVALKWKVHPLALKLPANDDANLGCSGVLTCPYSPPLFNTCIITLR